MTWDEPMRFPEPLDDPTDHIVEMMAQGEKGVDLDPDAVRLLISVARQAYRRCLGDWLRRNEPSYMEPPSVGPYAQWENRGKGNTGRFRDGSDMARPPLAAIYFLCNEWWRRHLGKFHPDFRALTWGEDFTYIEQLDMLHGPALFFMMIAQACDYHYTAERCAKVHATHYKLLKRRAVP